MRKMSQAGFDLGNIFQGLEKRQAAMLAAMLNMGADAFKRMTERITGTNAMMVMFERSMEGPANQLKVLGSQLMDIGLNLTGVVIPAIKGFVAVMGMLAGTIKDVQPWLALIGVLKLFSYAMGQTTIMSHGLTVAVTRLRAALTYLGRSPFLIAFTALIAGYSAITWAMEREAHAREERIKGMDREVSDMINLASSLETVKAAITSKNITELEAKRIVEGLSDKYKDIKDAAVQYGVKSKEFIDKVTDSLETLDKRIESMKLDRLAEEGRKYVELLEKLNQAQKKIEATGKEGVAGFFPGLELYPDAEAALEKIKKKFQDNARAIRAAFMSQFDVLEPFLRKYVEWEASAFRRAMIERGYTETMADELELARKQVISLVEGEKIRKKITVSKEHDADMEKALQKLREETGSAYDRLLAERAKKEAVFQGQSKEALEGRMLVEKWFQQEMDKLVEKEDERAAKIKHREMGLDVEAAKDSWDEVTRVQKESELKLTQIAADYAEERRKIRETEMATWGKISVSGRDAIVSLFRMETIARQNEIDKANRELVKITQNKIKKELDLEKKGADEKRKIQKEILALELTTAKESEDQLSALNESWMLEEADEYDAHGKMVADIWREHGDAMGEISEKGGEILALETQRHYAKLLQLAVTYQGRRADVDDKAEKDRLKKIQMVMRQQIEEATRGQMDLLRSLERQYDELAEVDRRSDYGKDLKAQIDRLTIEVYDRQKETIGSMIEWLKTLEDEYGNVAQTISVLQGEFDRYNDKVREATKSLAQHLEEQKGVWGGLKAGWKDFTNSLANEYEIGKELAKDFGQSVYKFMADPMEDFFIGKLKSFTDYWKSFALELNRIFARAVTQMIFEWMGLRAVMGGTEGAFWTTGLGALLQAIGFGGGGGTPAGSYGGPEGAYGIMHGGGTAKELFDRLPKMHSGYSGLDRDEVLVKMLKTEGVLNPRAMRTMGKEELDYRNRTGMVPTPNQFSSSVQIVLNERNRKLEGALKREIESTAIRVMREHSA